MEARSLTHPGVFAPRSRRLLGALGDDRLVEQLRRGNEAAFEAIYDRHHAGLLSFCRHMLGSREEAEDALQQVFVAAHDSLRRDLRPVALKPWLYTVARNRCLTVLRGRREQPADADEIATAGLAEQVETRAELRELLADLTELPEQQRAALVLFELGDLSQPEVAEVLGVEPGKVKALVFQARTSLTEMRNARAIPCAEIREQLATARGGVLRRGPLRRHLRGCPGCAAFRDEVRAQRAALAIVLPVIPSLGLRDTAMAAAGIGAGGGGAAGGGGLLAGLAAKGAAVKVAAATVATTAVVGGGAVVTNPPALLGGDEDDRPGASVVLPPNAAAAADAASQRDRAGGSDQAAQLALAEERASAAKERRAKRARRERARKRAAERREAALARNAGRRGNGRSRGNGKGDANRGGQRRSDGNRGGNGGGASIETPARGKPDGPVVPPVVTPPPVDPPASGKAKGKPPASVPPER